MRTTILKTVGSSLVRLKFSFLVFVFTTQLAVANSEKPDIIFQKDVDQEKSLLESYPVKICISELGYSPMAEKSDRVTCRERSDISYDDCLKMLKGHGDFSQVIVNKKFKAKTGDVIYLKKNMKYSFSTGSGGFVKDFTKEAKSIFVFGTANYGGVALDPVKKCP